MEEISPALVSLLVLFHFITHICVLKDLQYSASRQSQLLPSHPISATPTGGQK
jgi:hypothetical protein